MECHTVTMKIIKTIGVSGFLVSMYEKLYEWLQNNKDSMEEIHKFSTWQKVFDEIGGTYERVWSKEELDQGYLNN